MLGNILSHQLPLGMCYTSDIMRSFSYPNQKDANHIYRLPLDTCRVNDILTVNLFAKLDGGKVNKSKLIHNKCGKDLKCKIDEKTMNELKEDIKNELKKGLKFEIDDQIMNELKENIMSELKKGLKFEIGDKTKNELKENIKNELKKGLKFEIDDQTMNELKKGQDDKTEDDKLGDDKTKDDKTKDDKPEDELKKDLEHGINDNAGNNQDEAFSYHGYGNDLI